MCVVREGWPTRWPVVLQAPRLGSELHQLQGDRERLGIRKEAIVLPARMETSHGAMIRTNLLLTARIAEKEENVRNRRLDLP
jgi:hypothetical protein